MLDITFITSNITKLAHARYLSRNHNVNILHYKKKYYGVGYTEPRILDKMKLLEESMNDAIKRWKKVVSVNSTQLFFIEDTSVRIEALSNNDTDYPGADIKYWMLENDFNNINNILIINKDRKVSITSHIVLFLTKELKELSSIDNEYIIFKSTSFGKIVDQEYSFETNIIYPWLDNKTFNKWFVPNGYNVPISILKISDADNGDFRKESFEQMYKFLGKYYNLNKKNKLENINMSFSFSPLFIISGTTCAGKSTIGKYLLEIYGYYHIEASDFMTLRYLETHGTKFIIDKHNFAAEILKNNPLIVVEDTIKYIKEKKIKNKIIITGFRTSYEISSFYKIFSNHDIKMIYILADFDIRFNRWVKRNRDMTEYTIERFKKINDTQDKMGLNKIKNMKNIILFDNNQEGLDIFYNNFNAAFINNESISKKMNIELNIPQKILLEKAILITLAIKYKENEYNYYTTTEISYLIREIIKGSNKNKNNISRYFNQSFYPYYEIKKENNKLKYKLSPTGYSEACNIINTI